MSDTPYTLTLVTPPATTAVEVCELREFCRVDFTEEDAIFERAIEAAEAAVQARNAVQLISATYELRLRNFPTGAITLPRVPLGSVVSVKYVDLAGDTQTVDGSQYEVVPGSLDAFGCVVPSYNGTWPSDVRGYVVGDVTVRFTAGWASASAVPAALRQQVLLLASHLWRTRSAVCETPGGVVPLAMDLLEDVTGVVRV